MRLRRAADRPAQPWRNGNGVTREVAASDRLVRGTPLWRVSIATIAHDSEFSAFPGIDRMLAPLGADGLTLVIDGAARRVAQHEVVAFAGEQAVAAISVARPGDDLNLMVAREGGAGVLEVLPVAGAAAIDAEPTGVVLVVALDGALACGDTALQRHDAIALDAGESVELSGVGVVAVARVRLR